MELGRDNDKLLNNITLFTVVIAINIAFLNNQILDYADIRSTLR